MLTPLEARRESFLAEKYIYICLTAEVHILINQFDRSFDGLKSYIAKIKSKRFVKHNGYHSKNRQCTTRHLYFIN